MKPHDMLTLFHLFMGSLCAVLTMISCAWWLNDLSMHSFNARLFTVFVVSLLLGAWMCHLYDHDYQTCEEKDDQCH